MLSTTEQILIIALVIVSILAISGYLLVVWVVRIAINSILREMHFVKSSVTVTEQYVYAGRRDIADLARDLNTFFRLWGVLRPIEAERQAQDELRARAPPGGREPDL